MRFVPSFTVAAFALVGCGSPSGGPCMTVGGPSPLIAQTALFHLDLYDAQVACRGATVAAGSVPILSANFLAGAPISINVPSGDRTIVLSAFADANATHLLGAACLTADLTSDSLCLDLPIVAGDAAAFGGGSDGGGDATMLKCPGVGCSCDQSWDCGFANGLSCCNHVCVSTRSDPSNCGGCGNGCGSGDNLASASCNNGSCVYQCDPGFAACDSKQKNNCDSPTNSVDSCGGCTACDTASSSGASCDGTSCHYTSCNLGRIDCNTDAPNTDGCECSGDGCCGDKCQTHHDNGCGQAYYDCESGCTQVSATDACAAFTGDPAKCHMLQCSNNKSAICSDGGTRCICWGFSSNLSCRYFDSGNLTCTCSSGDQGSWG